MPGTGLLWLFINRRPEKQQCCYEYGKPQQADNLGSRGKQVAPKLDHEKEHKAYRKCQERYSLLRFGEGSSSCMDSILSAQMFTPLFLIAALQIPATPPGPTLPTGDP
jgi:hypothetical protein